MYIMYMMYKNIADKIILIKFAQSDGEVHPYFCSKSQCAKLNISL